jgi:hypothetical protein
MRCSGTLFAQFLEDDAKDEYKALHARASAAFAQYCQGVAPLDETFCGLLKQVIAMPEPTAQNVQGLKQVVSSDTFTQAYVSSIGRFWVTAGPVPSGSWKGTATRG